MNIVMHKIILHYYKGEGIEKNLEKAFYWYQKAAESGFEIAQNNFALLYKNGEGTEKNIEKAFYWYQKNDKEITKINNQNEYIS